jgi:hypothetical protein
MSRWQQRESEWLRKLAMQRHYERIFKADADDVEEETDDGNGNEQRHHVDQLADLLVEAGTSDGELSREEALRWLLHTRDGSALIARMRAHKRTTSMENVVTIAKCIAEGKSWLTEEELTAKIFKYAQASRLPNESPEQAFAKVFAANTPEGVAFRTAVAVAKARPPSGDDDEVAALALAKLERLAAARRKLDPSLSPEQAFAKCFADPANRELAELAHRRPVATW